MKTFPILCLSFLLSTMTLPVLGELTDADLDKIRLIVKEEVEAEIAGLKQELKAEIANSEKNIKYYIDAKIEGVDKRLSTYGWVIYVLMPLIVVLIGIPTVLITWRSGSNRSLEQQVEMLTQEVELLKQQRIVNP